MSLGDIEIEVVEAPITFEIKETWPAGADGADWSDGADGADYVISPGSVESTASLTINADTYNMYVVTALAVNMTINAPTGTPVNWQEMLIRILDNSTSRTLTWNAIFRATGISLPTATTSWVTLYVSFKYNTADSKWDALRVSEWGGVGTTTPPSAAFRSWALQSADSISRVPVQRDTHSFIDANYTHNTATNNSRVTVGTTDRYLIIWAINYTGSSTNYRFSARVEIRINGSTILPSNFDWGYIRAQNGADESSIPFMIIVELTAGDYFEILQKRTNEISGDSTMTAGTNMSITRL
jgi:hypothetical protein